MSLKGKTKSRSARCDILKATARARQRAQARVRSRTKAKPYDRLAYDKPQDEESNV